MTDLEIELYEEEHQPTWLLDFWTESAKFEFDESNDSSFCQRLDKVQCTELKQEVGDTNGRSRIC